MALNIKVSSSDWIDLRTRGYTSGMYLLNAVGAAIEYSTAATPVPGTTLVGSSAALISGTYLWARGSGDCELYTAAEWADANTKTVPVMASTSSSGGGVGFDAATQYAIRLGQGYEEIHDYEWTELTDAMVRPIASRMRDGFVYGTKSGLLYRSNNGARTWQQVGTATLTENNTPHTVLPLGDGQALICCSFNIYRTSGWNGGTVTSTKVLTSVTANFLEWGVDTTDDGRCVATHYAAGANFTASTFVWYSDNNGATWRVIRDLTTDSKNDRHIHFAMFDKFGNDRIYIAHHNEAVGGSGKAIEYTDDAGTWYEVPDITVTDDAGAPRVVQPTTAVSTPEGIIMGSDDNWSGLYILRRGSTSVEKFVSGPMLPGSISVPVFATYSERDPKTGDVYTCFVQQQASSPGFLMATDGVGGSTIYTHPEAYPVSGYGGVQGLPGFSSFTMTDSEIIAIARRPSLINPANNAYWMLRTPRPARVATQNAGRRYIPYGTKARVESPALCDLAESTGTNTFAAGYAAKATSNTSSVVVGNKSEVTSNDSVLFGNNIRGDYASCVLVGNGTSVTGGEATVAGFGASAGAAGTAYGKNASALSGTVSIGKDVKSNTGSADGVGVGRLITVMSYAVQIGTEAGASTGGVSIGWKSIGGNGVAIGYNSKRAGITETGYVLVGRDSACSASDTVAVGKSASAAHSNSVALGAGAETQRTDSVCVGARDVESVGPGKGLILQSPDGTKYRIAVGNGGAISATVV